MYYVYILSSGDEKYVGVTKNLKNRLYRHNSGHNKSTKYRNDWEIVHFESFSTLSEARKKESEIKGKHKKLSLDRDVAQPG